MNNDFSTTNQNAKLALSKSKSLLGITNKILANKSSTDIVDNFENFRFYVGFKLCSEMKLITETSNEGNILHGNDDATITLWDIKSRKELKNGCYSQDAPIPELIAITPDGKYIIGEGHNNTIRLWDIESGKEIRSFEGHNKSISSITITPDGKYIISGSYDETVKLWDIESGKERRSYEGEGGSVRSVAITPDSNYILSSSSNKDIKLWEITSGEEIESYFWGSKDIDYVVVTPNGKYIVGASREEDYDDNIYGKIHLWEIESEEKINSFDAYHVVHSITMTPDGKYIVSGGDDGTIIQWDMKSYKKIRKFKGHRGSVDSITITPDGKYIITGGSDDAIKLWEIEGKREIEDFKHSYFDRYGHIPDIVEFIPDEGYIVKKSGDEELILCEREVGKEIGSFESHSDWINSISITSNGKYIVSRGRDSTIKLWEFDSRKLVSSYMTFKDNEWLSWTSDGCYNCSDGAYKYFCFIDNSENQGEVIQQEHSVYKAKKKDILLNNYTCGINPYAHNPPPKTSIPTIDIHD